MKKIWQSLCMGLLLGGVFLITACAGRGQTDQTKSGSQSSASAIPLEQEAGRPTRQAEEKEEKENKKKKKVVYTTFFPVYDLAKRIIGDRMEIRMIIQGNQEPHDFELQASEMADISKADLIIYNGAGMEGFIPDLQEMMQDESKFLDLSQGLTLLDSTSDDGVAAEGEHLAINPHTWLSIKNALIELDTIYQKLITIDPDYADTYQKNLEAATDEFQALETKFSQELAKVGQDNRYFVVSHAAFNYLANDYGLKQVAVTGISPEDEPTAQQLKKIADFVKQHEIKTIFFEGKATPKVAQTLADNTGTKTDTIYTMENLTQEEIELGYLRLMEKNLEALLRSFNE